MDSLTYKVYGFVRNHRLLEDGDRVIAGISGGADSVCLLRILCGLKDLLHLQVRAVHINHGLRGEAADADQEFTRQLCNRLGVKCLVYKADIASMAKKKHLTEEEAGRIFRYECFEKAALEFKAQKIAVAHHMDDQTETVLMNLFRGSGLNGLAGIRAKRGAIIRPLLCLRRKEIEEYLGSLGQDYCTDQTNFETDHTRNKLRLELMPYVRENINSEADSHISGTAMILSDILDHLENEVRKCSDEIIREDLSEGKIYINIEGFQKLDCAIGREVVRKALGMAAGKMKDIEFSHIEAVRKLFDGKSGSTLNLPYGLLAVKEYENLVIEKAERDAGTLSTDAKKVKNVSAKEELLLFRCSNLRYRKLRMKVFHKQSWAILHAKHRPRPLQFTLYVNCNGNVDFCGKKIHFSLEKNAFFEYDKNAQIPQNMYTKWFDYDKIKSGLCLRHRRAGDFMIIGGGKNKLLKRILIDDKIPSAKRDELVLLADDSHILWIADSGRISEFYKVTAETSKVLKAEIIMQAGKESCKHEVCREEELQT